MAKHNKVHMEDTDITHYKTKERKCVSKEMIYNPIHFSLSPCWTKWLIIQIFFYLPPYQQTGFPPSATLWLILLPRLRAKKTRSHNWMRTNATAPTRAIYIQTGETRQTFSKFILQFKVMWTRSEARRRRICLLVLLQYLFGNERFFPMADRKLQLRCQSTEETSITKLRCENPL